MSNTIPDYWVPVNRNLAGDFIGFTFDNIHSSDFNLVRVSNGSRYESNLLPSFQDITVQGEGKDGLYYFGSTFREYQLKISTAFDELTEVNYRKMIDKFSDKKLHKLWFDEAPYKVFYVKLKQVPTFKNICFDEGENKRRIYKGEMELEFTCYPAWGQARANYLDQVLPVDEFVLVFAEPEYEFIYHNHVLEEAQDQLGLKLKRFYKYYGKDGATLSNSYNLEEWREASGLQDKLNGETAENENEKAETTETEEGIQYQVYNPGNKKADIKLIYTPDNPEDGGKTFPSIEISLIKKSGDLKQIIGQIGIKSFPIKEIDKSIAIDSKTHLISGLTVENQLSGNVYNKYHIKGDFFDIPQCSISDEIILQLSQNSNSNGESGTWSVEYSFYYV